MGILKAPIQGPKTKATQYAQPNESSPAIRMIKTSRNKNELFRNRFTIDLPVTPSPAASGTVQKTKA